MDESSQGQSPDEDVHFMREALALGDACGRDGEVPVGAVLVREAVVLGRGGNRPVGSVDPTAHAEIAALRAAARNADNYRLPGTTLYVTVEPCTMCAGALLHARVERLVFGATEPKAGAVVSTAQVFENARLNHAVRVRGGVLAEECAALMQAFFRARR